MSAFAEKRKAELQAEVSMLRRECAEASGFVAVSTVDDISSAEDGTTKQTKSSLEERAAAKHEHAAMMAKISESRNRDVSDSLRVALKESMQRSQSSQEASIAAQRHVVELRSQLNSARAESRALSETMEVVRADLKAARADALRKHLAEQSVRAELDAMRDDRVALASRNETSSVKLSESEAVLRRRCWCSSAKRENFFLFLLGGTFEMFLFTHTHSHTHTHTQARKIEK